VSATPVTDACWDVDVIHAADAVIVAFFSAGSSTCRGLRDDVDQLAAAVHGHARVFLIDIDDNPAAARRYDVTSLPTLLVFRRGEVMGRLVGARSADRLLADLSPYLG
jgi:thioredoxin 1